MKPNNEIIQRIEVNGNFTQGDISGQSAIGSNISQQITYNSCTFVYPDSSTKQGYSWIYTQGARPTIDLKRVFGRETELEKIEKYLKDNSALVITGLRGTGKSTLASMFVDKIEESGRFAGIYWRKINETTDISDIIGGFFTVIGKAVKDLEHYKIADQITLLFCELNKASYLLILDNFEILLNSQTNKPLESKVGFSDLIEKANENCIRSKILFTSWDSLASERGIRPFSYQIKGLNISAGILLLKRERLNEPETELKKAIELSGGHPLALILLAQLVREGAGTLSDLLNDDSLWIGKEGEVAENILNKIYNERLSEDERKLLQYVSLFRQPVPAKAISEIANDPNWNEPKVNKIALKLIRKSLLQKTGNNYWEESLISKYAVNQLSDPIECNKLVYKYYISIPLPIEPTKKQDVQPLIEAHYHACMAEEYDLAANIIFDRDLHNNLGKWGNYKTLIELCEKVLPKNHFGTEILLSNKNVHGWVILELGQAYQSIGEIENAIKHYEQSLLIAIQCGDIHEIGNCFDKLGLAHGMLGNVRKAIEYHKKVLKISRATRDRELEGKTLGHLGLAYLRLGSANKVLEYSKPALTIAIEVGNKRGEGTNLGNIGSAYLLLMNPKKAIEYHEKALIVSREINDRKGEEADLRNLANAYLMLGDKKTSLEYFEKALSVAKETENLYTEELAFHY